MIDFIGRYTREELCREWVLRASAFGELPVMSDHIGSAWNSKVYFLGFSRSGWKSGALAYQQEINQHPLQGDDRIAFSDAG